MHVLKAAKFDNVRKKDRKTRKETIITKECYLYYISYIILLLYNLNPYKPYISTHCRHKMRIMLLCYPMLSDILSFASFTRTAQSRLQARIPILITINQINAWKK